MHTINSLRLDRETPPRIHHEHLPSTRQIETYAAGAQTEEEDVGFGGCGEFSEDGGAGFLRHGAVEAEVGDVVAG